MVTSLYRDHNDRRAVVSGQQVGKVSTPPGIVVVEDFFRKSVMLG